jgi:hypothetical protein
MDVAVFLLFALFFGGAVAAAWSRYDVLRDFLLLNVAASCGVAVLHGCLRGRTLAGSAPAAVVAGAASTACLPEPSSSSGGQADDYSVLGGVISASSLFRRSARSAIDPQEG